MAEREYYQPKGQFVTQASQAMVERADIPRSTFVGRKMRRATYDASYLYPFHLDELLPGDDMTFKVSAYLRMQTPLFPLFSNFKVETFWFFVPHRLTWENFQRFMGEQPSPGSGISFTIPTGPSPAGGWAPTSLQAHFGLPIVGQVTAGQVVDSNIMPLRAYYLIWNQWFRDENSVNGLTVPLTDTSTETGYVLQRRMKGPDRFTRALPWPQKFTAPAALGSSAPVLGIGVDVPATTGAGPTNVRGAVSSGAPTGSYVFGPHYNDAANTIYLNATATDGPLAIFADLSQISVNTLRLSFMVQQLLERDARGGTRYVEVVKSHFGVTSPDARLQRPEYIGGGASQMNLTPIAQTATGGAGVGALGAAGSSFLQHGCRYTATEHGFIIGLINISTELAYQQGLHKLWSRRTRYDFYWPSLAGLGEQAILRQEIYCTGVDVDDATVFGYGPAWDEYRQMYSDVVGLFNSRAAGNIDEWHTAQDFGAAPVLGATFLQDDTTTIIARNMASAFTGMQYLADIMIERQATRPLPVYGTPATLGRF